MSVSKKYWRTLELSGGAPLQPGPSLNTYFLVESLRIQNCKLDGPRLSNSPLKRERGEASEGRLFDIFIFTYENVSERGLRTRDNWWQHISTVDVKMPYYIKTGDIKPDKI